MVNPDSPFTAFLLGVGTGFVAVVVVYLSPIVYKWLSAKAESYNAKLRYKRMRELFKQWAKEDREGLTQPRTKEEVDEEIAEMRAARHND
jgi:hypothetical protein